MKKTTVFYIHAFIEGMILEREKKLEYSFFSFLAITFVIIYAQLKKEKNKADYQS